MVLKLFLALSALHSTSLASQTKERTYFWVVPAKNIPGLSLIGPAWVTCSSLSQSQWPEQCSTLISQVWVTPIFKTQMWAGPLEPQGSRGRSISPENYPDSDARQWGQGGRGGGCWTGKANGSPWNLLSELSPTSKVLLSRGTSCGLQASFRNLLRYLRFKTWPVLATTFWKYFLQIALTHMAWSFGIFLSFYLSFFSLFFFNFFYSWNKSLRKRGTEMPQNDSKQTTLRAVEMAN